MINKCTIWILISILLLIGWILFAFVGYHNPNVFTYFMVFLTLLVVGLIITCCSQPESRIRTFPILILICIVYFSLHRFESFAIQKQCRGFYGELKSKCLIYGGIQLIYRCIDKDSSFEKEIKVPIELYNTIGDYPVILSSSGDIIESNLDSNLAEKYRNGIIYINFGIGEYGNKTIEYAQYERDIVYKHYGFNLVFKAVQVNPNTVKVFLGDGKFHLITMNNVEDDSFLVYCNINPLLFDGWHLYKTPFNNTINMSVVEKDDYCYLFNNILYSKDTIERRWNIINNYIQAMDSLYFLNY